MGIPEFGWVKRIFKFYHFLTRHIHKSSLILSFKFEGNEAEIYQGGTTIILTKDTGSPQR